MPATSQAAQTALLFPLECQSSMSPDFLGLRYLQSAADDTPLHTPPPPPVILSSFSGGAKRSFNGTQRSSCYCCHVVRNRWFRHSQQHKVLSFIFFLTILSLDYPNLFMYQMY